MRRYVIMAVMVLAALGAVAQASDYARLEAKAARFFDNSEWLNASAMYTLMQDQKPDVASTYSHNVVSLYMAGEPDRAMAVLGSAFDAGLPLDTLLGQVQRVSRVAGNGAIYEQVLLRAHNMYPWLGRSLDKYLLNYYTFKDNGPKMVEYARMMLAGLPDDVAFRRILARGYMLQGNTAQAVAEWADILRLAPDNVDTLLDMANYLLATGQPVEARPLLQQAYALRPTPYVQQLLAKKIDDKTLDKQKNN